MKINFTIGFYTIEVNNPIYRYKIIYKSLQNILSSFKIFYFFLKWKMKNDKYNLIMSLLKPTNIYTICYKKINKFKFQIDIFDSHLSAFMITHSSSKAFAYYILFRFKFTSIGFCCCSGFYFAEWWKK